MMVHVAGLIEDPWTLGLALLPTASSSRVGPSFHLAMKVLMVRSTLLSLEIPPAVLARESLVVEAVSVDRCLRIAACCRVVRPAAATAALLAGLVLDTAPFL